MKRDAFGDPQPRGHLEIMQVLFEKEWEPSDCTVYVEHIEQEAPYGGWSAEILNGLEIVGTLGYESRDELMKDLKACGFRDVRGR